MEVTRSAVIDHIHFPIQTAFLNSFQRIMKGIELPKIMASFVQKYRF